MNYLVWRLHRNQVYFAAGALALLTILLLATGLTMAHDYRVFLANCGLTQSCVDGRGQLFSGDGAIIDLVNLTLVVPLLFGLFWGAPLLAKEYEDGTQNLAWTQGVPRHRWLSVNMMWAIVAATIWGAAMSALVSWWRIPENALNTRFGNFDIQGIVPVAYSIFAVALGIAVGSIFKRVLPAIATTLGVFAGIRTVIAIYVRPHYMTAITKMSAPTGSWGLSSGIAGPGGTYYGHSFSLQDIPAACQSVLPGGKGGLVNCLTSHGFRQMITYQPDSRFWAFQGVEAGLFIVLSVGLLGLAYRMVLTRDA
jgi:hypothetical protein